MPSLLNGLFGGDNVVVTVIVALAAVILLIVLGVWGLKLVFNATGRAARGRAKRLGVVDISPVDQKRQLVLIRRDNTEHLLLIGGPQDLVIESGISAGPAATRPSRPAAQPAQPMPLAPSPQPQPNAPIPMAPAPSSPPRRVRETNLPPDLTALRNGPTPGSGSLRNTALVRSDERREPEFIPSMPPDWSSPFADSDTPFGAPPVPVETGLGSSEADNGDRPDLERDGNDPRQGESDQKD